MVRGGVASRIVQRRLLAYAKLRLQETVPAVIPNRGAVTLNPSGMTAPQNGKIYLLMDKD